MRDEPNITDLHRLRQEFDFPVDEYLQGNIRAARTLTRTGPWWSAVLLIADPASDRTYVAMYRWKKVEGSWKRANKFTCWSKDDAMVVREFIQQHQDQLA